MLYRETETDCRHCANGNVLVATKEEGTAVKELYLCDSCGAEWTEWN